ncbi:ATP11-domain-containing protein [Microthyrium microscopicum]|uniref:ATP11-domain-containing protein n=1 Tax=Microthyrium microscopicum TaxID=703497 RepID=A0A6A6UIW7_9PEZI|nr:ATP11-domain-containing protein [Microthyrium microscopicum]
MKVPKNPSIRRLFFKPGLVPRFQQRRWAKVQDIRINDARFLATQATQERVFEKYRDKLSRRAKEEGHHDVGSLRKAYEAKIEALKNDASLASKKTLTKNTDETTTQIPFSPPPPPEPQSPKVVAPKTSDVPGVKTLSSFIDLDKTKALPPKEIEYIWRLRHAKDANSLCAVIPGPTYAHLSLLARKHPQFVLPVPREGQGAEIHFLQWTFPHPDTATVLFTQLAEYKLRGEYASPHTTVSLHSELLVPKGLVLAQGNVQDERGMTVEDGRWLLMCLQKFYGPQAGEDGLRRRKLLEQFSNGDSGFSIQELLDEAERF